MAQVAIRGPFISPAHLSKPERLPLPEEGSIYKGVAYCATSRFYIRSQRQDPQIVTFAIRVYCEIYCCMLKHLVPRFRHDITIIPFKDIAKLQVPAKLEPIVEIQIDTFLQQINLLASIGKKTSCWHQTASYNVKFYLCYVYVFSLLELTGWWGG